jgi:endonuclease-8
MPEGHTVHRIANEFNERFGGKVVRVDSPQGRFGDSKLVDGRVLVSASAVGKQMFLDFGEQFVLRIHLGIYGKWKFCDGGTPTVVGQVRARFMIPNLTAELRGPTICELIEPESLQAVFARLGPDPINPDADGLEFLRFSHRVAKSSTPIGLLLMNQEVISGIGNVYRAEILFRARVNPHTPGSSLSPRKVRALWDDSVMLLNVGVKHGVMITRDEFLEEDPGKSERNWVYKREGESCRRCRRKIRLEMAAGRKLYWCPGCQK